jgi:glycerophosphoryl diester phosphodiesterase
MQYDLFYNQFKLSPASYVQKAMRSMRINYLSSAEIGFLKNMNGKVNTARTKLVFQALGADEIEPTTNKTYSKLLQDLASIKLFATGILVPKEYIWPVQAGMYLGAPTTLVSDAHKQGLEVYASGFANDFFASYNYSYDPTSEYLQFVDNSKFSVDGVLTDFSPTASEAIGEITDYQAFTIFLEVIYSFKKMKIF